MKTLRRIHKMAGLGLSTRDKQTTINVSEVFHLWNHLIQRYNVIYTTEILETFARDEDLLLVLGFGKMTLGNHIKILEKEVLEYGIPLPIRPPKQTHSTVNVEQISDRYIFRRVLRGIQAFPAYTYHGFCSQYFSANQRTFYVLSNRRDEAL